MLMTTPEALALHESILRLMGTAKYWGLKCPAKEAIRKAIGLGGGFSLSGEHGYNHSSHSDGGIVSIHSNGFAKTVQFKPHQYMPIAERIWAEINPAPNKPQAGQLSLF